MLEVENLIKFRLGGLYVCIIEKNSIIQNMEANMRGEYWQLKETELQREGQQEFWSHFPRAQ